ncbi:hypothetical protein HBN50_14155 [Halobacteriovorax sp. GB3]|uniref:hypothetical protein n=1 Tax=Halobacteriovorax sp. GB3 TaxID=2719615 RepID=UPI0023603A10|nr:hypothetical protein [Halobacteriovorax sp. GB3]MDD0854252.1 hypothetical protein [Halobacteriovorax sp. GB3]
MEDTTILEKIMEVRPKAIVKFLYKTGDSFSNHLALTDDFSSVSFNLTRTELIEKLESLNKEEIDEKPRDIIKFLILRYKKDRDDLIKLQKLTKAYKQRVDARNHDQIGISELPFFETIQEYRFKKVPNPLDLHELSLVQELIEALDTGVLIALEEYIKGVEV